MEKITLPVASVYASKSGIMVDADNINPDNKHYNVVIEKVEDRYVITGEQALWDIFITEVSDKDVIDKISEKYVKTSEAFFFGLVKPQKYVKGWCELKERHNVQYTCNQLTIKRSLW
jgi:hypothetical protein